MIRAGVRPDLLLHGVRSAGELYFREELEAAVRRYVPCLSTDSAYPGEAFRGYVTRFLQARLTPMIEAPLYPFCACTLVTISFRCLEPRFRI